MGISPIDLQTMYSQMNNIAREVSYLQQGVPLAASMQEKNIMLNKMEERKKVQEAKEGEHLQELNQNGSNSTFLEQQRKQKKDTPEEEGVENKTKYAKESYLGNRIDIIG